jgi:hypothetical protein
MNKAAWKPGGLVGSASLDHRDGSAGMGGGTGTENGGGNGQGSQHLPWKDGRGRREYGMPGAGGVEPTR